LKDEFPEVPQYRVDLAQMHRSAGRWTGTLGPGNDQMPTNEHLRAAVKLLRGLVKDFPDVPLYRQQLAAALSQLALQTGIDKWQEITDIQMKLIAEFPSVPDYRADLAVSYNYRGWQLLKAGNVISAAEWNGKSLDLWRKLIADFPNVTWYQRCVSIAL